MNALCRPSLPSSRRLSIGCGHLHKSTPSLTISRYQSDVNGCKIILDRPDPRVARDPRGRYQSVGNGFSQARMARLWPIDGFARRMWPKNLRRVVRLMLTWNYCCVGNRASINQSIYRLRPATDVQRRLTIEWAEVNTSSKLHCSYE